MSYAKAGRALPQRPPAPAVSPAKWRPHSRLLAIITTNIAHGISYMQSFVTTMVPLLGERAHGEQRGHQALAVEGRGAHDARVQVHPALADLRLYTIAVKVSPPLRDIWSTWDIPA